MRSLRGWVAIAAGTVLVCITLVLVARSRRGAASDGASRPAGEAPALASRARIDGGPRSTAPATSARELVEPASAAAISTESPSARLLVRGRVVDPDGKPLAGAVVLAAAPCAAGDDSMWSALDAPRAEPCGAVMRAACGADGAFELDLARGDELQLAVRHPGFVGLDLEREPSEEQRELDLGTQTLALGATLPGLVVDESGRPVGGAEVARVGIASLSDRIDIDWSDVVLATSAADGRFQLDTLALGPTELEVRAPGFVHLRREVFAGDERLPEWRVELQRAAPITGRVVGAPADAKIGVSFWVKPENEAHYVACTGDGSFSIDGLPPEMPAFALYAELAGGRASPSWNRMGGERLSPSVKVKPGMHDVELRVPPPVTYRLTPVDARANEPLSGASVTLILFSGRPDARAGETRFEPPGTYSLSAVLPSNDLNALSITAPGHEGVILGALPLEPGTTHDLGEVPMTPLEATAVRVFTSSGEPAVAARVRARIAPSDEWNDIIRPYPARSPIPATWDGTTGADGIARVLLSSDQRYRITVEHEDHAPLEVPLDVGEHPPPELELHLVRGGAVLVTCVDRATLAPLARHTIDYQQGYGPSGWRPEQESTTDADGRLRLAHLAPGRYRFWLAELDSDEDAELVQVDDGASVELKLFRGPDRSVRLHGTITEHGAPLVGAKVEDWGGATATDKDGRYEFRDEESGETQLTVTHPRYGPIWVQDVELVAPETVVDLDLTPVRLEGVVRDEAGAPLAGATARIRLHGEDGGLSGLLPSASALHWTTSAADGSFAFDAVQPQDGLYLVVEKAGFRTERIEPLAFPLDGTPLVVRAVLRRALELDVVVQDTETRLATQVIAVWRGDEELAPDDREQKPEPRRPEDAVGHFRFTRLRPGPWSIELRDVFSGDDARPLARADVLLTPENNPPVVLRP